MSLTTQQKATLKAFVEADPVLSTYPHNSDGAFAIADALGDNVVPDFIVYKSKVRTNDIGTAVNYIAVEAMTDANRVRITTFYSMNPVDFKPTADIRSYWANTFSGALGGQGATTRTALENLWKRKANVLEKLFAVGTGTDVAPAELVIEGTISYGEIVSAMGW